jgi:hypothetical protein
MKNRLYKKWVDFFKAPDWMLRKDLFALILCLPIGYILVIALFIRSGISNFRNLESDVVYIEKLLDSCEKVDQSDRKSTIDHEYVKTVLEELTFLSEDRKQLALICSEVEEKDLYPKIKERLSFLQNGCNQLKFSPQEKSDRVVWELKNKVEMNVEEIKNLLTLVEGEAVEPFYPNPHRPELYFSKVKLKRMNKGTTDIFTVDLQLCQKR